MRLRTWMQSIFISSPQFVLTRVSILLQFQNSLCCISCLEDNQTHSSCTYRNRAVNSHKHWGTTEQRYRSWWAAAAERRTSLDPTSSLRLRTQWMCKPCRTSACRGSRGVTDRGSVCFLLFTVKYLHLPSLGHHSDICPPGSLGSSHITADATPSPGHHHRQLLRDKWFILSTPIEGVWVLLRLVALNITSTWFTALNVSAIKL